MSLFKFKGFQTNDFVNSFSYYTLPTKPFCWKKFKGFQSSTDSLLLGLEQTGRKEFYSLLLLNIIGKRFTE